MRAANRCGTLLTACICLVLLACTLSPAAGGRSGGRLARTGGQAAASESLYVDDAHSQNPALFSSPLSAAPGIVAPPATLALPQGFTATVIATGLNSPRFMAFDPSGNLLIGSLDGSIYRLPAAAGGSVASATQPLVPLISGLRAPHSIVVHNGYLYVAETDQVSRYAYGPAGSLGPRQTVIPDLPTGGHFTRTVVFGSDGALYLSVGSSCNICDEQDQRRAAILRYNADGSGYQRFAWGARNAVGLAFRPGSGELWATVNERDDQGNEIPPDLVTVVNQGDNFGWPGCLPPDAAPQKPGNDCRGITPPTVAIQAHSAPLGLAFYTGGQFPAEYNGDIFVVEHGSWNRQPPAPPQIVRVHFQNGQPSSVIDFATGWQTDDSGTRWGRPAGIIVAPDGSLIVSDDQAGYLYRISYAAS